MAVGGPQSVPGVTFHEAYRFEALAGDKQVEGFVYKALPRRTSWEARIDGTPILLRAETRREAVELAIGQAAAG